MKVACRHNALWSEQSGRQDSVPQSYCCNSAALAGSMETGGGRLQAQGLSGVSSLTLLPHTLLQQCPTGWQHRSL